MELKPLGTLTTTLRVFLGITIGVTIIAVLAGCYDYYSYSTLPLEVDANEVILTSDAVVALVGLVQLVLSIATGITFLMWIYRSNKNLRTLSTEPMHFTPGWSVGWYFVPIANLFKPYQVMKELWTVSHQDEDHSYAIVGWWWALWIISNLLSRIAFRLVLRAEDASDYAMSAMVYIISDGIDVILTVVALAMITRIAAAYATNFIEPSAAPYAPPRAV